MFGTKKEVRGGWRTVHNEELNSLRSFPRQLNQEI
jgi:hypothetical protein